MDTTSIFPGGALAAHFALFLASSWMWLMQVHAMKSAWAQRVGLILSIRAITTAEQPQQYEKATQAFNAYQPVIAATVAGWWSSIACALGTFAMLVYTGTLWQIGAGTGGAGDIYASAATLALAGAVLWAYALHRRARADRAYVIFLGRISVP